MIELAVDGELVRIDLDRVVNAGYSGRDSAAVQAHVDELEAEGIVGPDRIPVTYELSPYTTLVEPDAIGVVGADTSGEAEFGLLVGRDTYVVAASDHTDRDLETESIHKSKQVAPNVLSGRAWRLGDVRDHWDEIELRAWNWIDGERTLYQEVALESILPPEELLETVEERYGGPLQGTAILSGTVATVSGEIRPGDRFEVELVDPERDRSLSVAYDVVPVAQP